MKILPPLLLGLSLALGAHAQDYPAPAATAAAAPAQSPAALDTLLGPIALYPDPLVALILPASTSPSDIVLATRFLDAGNDPAAIESQPWSESVQALAHYPDVLRWMNQNLSWTQALGQTFLLQPADVMNAVQRLRTQAKNSGVLVSTPQQHVTEENGQILIEPAQPDIVYVPTYDPSVVFVQTGVWIDRPLLTFGLSYQIGSWFLYDCDWGHRTVWVTPRPANGRYQAQYWHPANTRPQNRPGQAWRPPANVRPPSHPVYVRPPAPRPLVIQHPVTPARPRETVIVPGAPRVVAPAPRAPVVVVRPPDAPRDNRVAPVIVTPPGTTTRFQRPVVGGRPTFVYPTRPQNTDNNDHANRPAVTPPPARTAPPARSEPAVRPAPQPSMPVAPGTLPGTDPRRSNPGH